MKRLYEIRNLLCSYDKDYREGKSKIVLEIKHLDIPQGDVVFIVGESGIGKSTVLEVLGLMNNTMVPRPDARFCFCGDNGEVTDLLQLWESGSDRLLSDFRLRHFSFIFQSTNLMRNFTAYENIALTRMLQGYPFDEAIQKATGVLEDLGLPQIGRERMVQELSGGQQQRLAFARAVLPDFSVLFGDEPTGNLDADNAQRVMELLLRKLNELPGASAVIVTHDMPLAIRFADRIIKIRKEYRTASQEQQEEFSFGCIDTDCVFTRDADVDLWSNGVQSYDSAAFEQFLKSVS